MHHRQRELYIFRKLVHCSMAKIDRRLNLKILNFRKYWFSKEKRLRKGEAPRPVSRIASYASLVSSSSCVDHLCRSLFHLAKLSPAAEVVGKPADDEISTAMLYLLKIGVYRAKGFIGIHVYCILGVYHTRTAIHVSPRETSLSFYRSGWF